MSLNSQQRLSRTSLIIFGLEAFLGGLGLARLKLPVYAAEVWLSLVVVCALAKPKNLLTAISVLIFGLLLGLWRGEIYLHRLSAYQNLYKAKVTIIGQADSDGVYGKGSQLAFDLVNLQTQTPYKSDLVGKIGVRGYGEKAVYRGDVVQVSGKLYATRGSRQASLSYAQIKVLSRSMSVINSLRRRFEAGMLSALPEPLASFGLGLLIGQRSTLPQAVNDQLSAAGLTHIVAVSGYNLTIIISGVYFVLKKFSKYQATLGSVLLIILFILLAGGSAPIVRAAIVSMLSLTASYYGRSLKPLMLILLAAAGTAGWSPTYLWSDIGWYLSFLAFFGILILAPLLIRRIYAKKTPRLVAVLIIETMAAQLMTVPIIMYIFGQVSLVALPANVLIVPLVPLAMLLSFVAALGGMMVPTVAGWLASPARILLTYMLDVISLAAKIPHALSQRTIPINQAIGLYGLVIVVCILLWLKSRQKNGIVTDINSED